MADVNWGLTQQGFNPIDSALTGYSYGQKIMDASAQRKAGQMYADGDTAGAAKALAASGDIQGASTLQANTVTQDAAKAKLSKSHLEFAGKAANIFNNIYDQHVQKGETPEQAAQAVVGQYDALPAAVHDQFGTPEENATFRAKLLADPKGTLTTLSGLIDRELSFQNSDGQTRVYDKNTGGLIRTDGERKATAPPAAVQEYEYAVKNGFKGSITDYQHSKAAATHITVDRGNADGGYRILTEDEKTANGLPKDGVYQVNAKGKIDRVAGNTSVKPIPAKALDGIQDNRNTLRKIDKAIELLRTPVGRNAVGLRNYLGDGVNQRLDPEGVDTRSYIADIGSQKLHDRSGAAVTVSESPRLVPFIPQVTDSPEAAIKKLQNLRTEYQSKADDTEAFYAPESGYMSVPEAVASPHPSAQGNGGWSVKRVK